MALKDLVFSVGEAHLMNENNRLREALRLARADLLAAVEEIDRELCYVNQERRD